MQGIVSFDLRVSDYWECVEHYNLDAIYFHILMKKLPVLNVQDTTLFMRRIGQMRRADFTVSIHADMSAIVHIPEKATWVRLKRKKSVKGLSA